MTRQHLLTAAEIEALAGNASPHPVSEKVSRVTKSLGDPTGLTAMGVHLFETAPGAESTAFHFHHFEDEAVYVLSGTAEAQIGDEIFEIGPGDFMGHPKGGAAHILRNTGEEPLRCLIMGERADHDVVDYPHANRRLTQTTGQDEVWEPLDKD